MKVRNSPPNTAATSSPRSSAPRTALGGPGYKVLRVLVKGYQPTREYEDGLTSFMIKARTVWSRPVGVAAARDGSLLISEEGSGTIRRVSYRGW